MITPEDCDDPEDLMPCGECCVCNEYLDHSDAGFCEHCGSGFHWNDCGTWEKNKHTCQNCSTDPDDI